VWLHKLESVSLPAIKLLQSKLKHGRRQKCTLLQGTMKFVFVVGFSVVILTSHKALNYFNTCYYYYGILVPKLIMEWIPEEKKRGRPRKTWMEGVQAAMTEGNLEQDQWRNREEWRLVSGRGPQLL
jgi:hypothetical protein